MSKALRMIEKAQAARLRDLKNQLLREFCCSIDSYLKDCNEPLENEDTAPGWSEYVNDIEYEFVRIQNVTNFGVLHLCFRNKRNPDESITLSLELKR